MIIKSLSRRGKNCFKNVIEYVLQVDKQKDNSILTRYIKGGNSLNNLIRSFESNEKKRLIKRKDSVWCFHDCVSFHKDDTKNLDDRKLKKIARAYMRLRSPKAIGLSVVHTDTSHVHIHFVFSGVEYQTGRSTRISRAKFKSIKLQMQELEKELGLEHSLVNHDKERGRTLADREFKIAQQGKISEKPKLIQRLESLFQSATSEKDFYTRIKAEGLEVYSRRGKITGVKLKRKYRFTTLGFSPDRIQYLDSERERRRKRFTGIRRNIEIDEKSRIKK